MTAHTENQLEQRARALYRRHAADIDSADAARLRRARQQALDAAAPRPHLVRWLMPAGALTTCALAAVLIWPNAPHPAHMTTPTPSALAAAANSNDDSLPPDPESTDPALYQNMDFYAWLADQPGTRKRHRGG